MEKKLIAAKEASFAMAVIPTLEKNKALSYFAQLVRENLPQLLSENQKDLVEQRGKISSALFARLGLDESKVKLLAGGIDDLVALEDPVFKVQWRRKLDEGLILEKKSVPLGVLGIIFESRPDVIPQILSLVLKSGNVAVLKGGKEAFHTNGAFMSLVNRLNEQCPFLPKNWAQLVESREEMGELLAYHQYVDLVIPRGSNELVQYVMNNTKIPVLGHADGICHMYIEKSANLDMALELAIDAKIQYPSACNALETLLIDRSVGNRFLPAFFKRASSEGIEIYAGPALSRLYPDFKRAENFSHEYSDLKMTVEIIDGLDLAIKHINTFGSHHTDCIVSEDKLAKGKFKSLVDSASVYSNASTRFADGLRYGMGAEVGISTSKIHARGPVGPDGLVTYKYDLSGQGQLVRDYTGPNARAFLHEDL